MSARYIGAVAIAVKDHDRFAGGEKRILLVSTKIWLADDGYLVGAVDQFGVTLHLQGAGVLVVSDLIGNAGVRCR